MVRLSKLKIGLEVEQMTVKEDILMSSKNKEEWLAKKELRIIQIKMDSPWAQGCKGGGVLWELEGGCGQKKNRLSQRVTPLPGPDFLQNKEEVPLIINIQRGYEFS